jgi:hypothetical protein
MVMVQVAALPLQAPPQPLKTLPLTGLAVSTTTAPLVKEATQVAPQSMPAGLDVIAPLPLTLTLSA